MRTRFKTKQKGVRMSFPTEHDDFGYRTFCPYLAHGVIGGFIVHQDVGMINIYPFPFECLKDGKHHINEDKLWRIAGSNMVQCLGCFAEGLNRLESMRS